MNEQDTHGASVARWWSQAPRLRAELHYRERVLRCMPERPKSVFALLRRAAEQHGAREAVVDAQGRHTYSSFLRDVENLARRFAADGIVAGDRVMMLAGNHYPFMLAFFALQRIGAVAVPAGIREQAPALAYMAVQCGAIAIIVDAALDERVPSAEPAPGLARRYICEELPALAAAAAELPPAAQPDAPEEAVAVILYTSGTTGKPKGAMLTHLGIVHSALHYAACMGLAHTDRSALVVPASHVTGLVGIVAALVHVGGCVLMLEQFKAADFIAFAARERMTHTVMVPAMYSLCLLQKEFGQADLSAWRIGGYGGAPMPPAAIEALAAALPRLTLMNAYGATETTSPAVMMPPGATLGHGDSVGVALPCADILVMDDVGMELPPGETGELWIGGPMVVPGYWDDAAATAREFSGGYWRSGDLGSIDAQGFVRIFDRKKDMLNRGGFKIYSVEVEHVLAAMPGVVEAAVVGRPCPVLGERVHAYVHAPDAELTQEAVQAWCAARLADYKVPESVIFSAQPLPRNANGKLLKRSLRERLEQNSE